MKLNIRRSGIAFYVNDMNSRTMYLKPNEKSLKSQFQPYQILKFTKSRLTGF